MNRFAQTLLAAVLVAGILAIPVRAGLVGNAVAGLSQTDVQTLINNSFLDNAITVDMGDAVFTSVDATTLVGDTLELAGQTIAIGAAGSAIRMDVTATNGLEIFGDVAFNEAADTAIGAGTCTSDSLNAGSNDTRGAVTATCTAGQTIIVTFGTTKAAAPYCYTTPINSAGTGAVHVATSTSALTMTSVGAITAGQINYLCFQ